MNRDMKLPPGPVTSWKPIEWKKVPNLPWPHKMINLAAQWSKFYTCKQCGLCCLKPPLIKVEKGRAYYLPKNEHGYCIMFDEDKKLCRIYDERPVECRLLVCKAPQSVKDRLNYLLMEFLELVAPEIEKNIEEGREPEEAMKDMFGDR